MSANTVVIPGALSRDDLDASAKGWSVESGQPERGDAWTDHTNCRVRIPRDDSPESEAIRMHELMHVKVSPRRVYEPIGVRPEIVEACEEIRVNELARRVGVDLDLLVDGSEKFSGTRVRHDRDAWRNAVLFTAATHGGKAQREFLLGIKLSNPTWVMSLRRLVKDLNKVMKSLGEKSWASTVLNTHGIPEGFYNVIRPLGRVVEAYWYSDPEQLANDPNALKKVSKVTEGGARRPPSNEWAELIVGETDLSVTVTGASVSRKRHPAQSGARVGYASRILTDPQRRVFTGVKRGGAGVVLIDMSGSMDIDPEQVDELLKVARGLTVLGYSHRPGDIEGTPNAWVLARNGRRVASQDLRSGNVGNGVDGPALKWAQKFRESGQPLVWVFDGQATDSNDLPFGTEECAKFIKQNKVHCVRDLREAIYAFRKGQNLTSMKFPEGRVGRAAKGDFSDV